MLEGKVVVLIGGAGLLGKEIAKAAAEAGATVIVADRDLEAANRVAKALSSNAMDSAKVTGVRIDVTDKASIDELIASVRSRHSSIDAVVNVSYPRNPNYGRDFFDVEFEDYAENLGLHLGGYFLVSQRFAAHFTNQGHGNIINFASIYGVVAPRFQIYEGTAMTTPPDYVAIKAGIIHLTRYLARRLRGNNIRANVVSPGGIADNQPAVFQDAYRMFCSDKGMLEPGDITGTVLFLLSDYSKYLTGQNIIVDDGFSL